MSLEVGLREQLSRVRCLLHSLSTQLEHDKDDHLVMIKFIMMMMMIKMIMMMMTMIRRPNRHQIRIFFEHCSKGGGVTPMFKKCVANFV